MPFSKYVIKTEKTEDDHVFYKSHEKKEGYDDSGVANQRMVNVIRHMCQLLNVADDIFGAIEMEIRDIVKRTLKLNSKVQNCQYIVDNLNAKTEKVPICSLSDTQAAPRFKSSSFEKCDNALIFSRIPRPIAVERLRDLADGPTSPVVIPCGMVSSEVDGFNGGTLSSSDSGSTSTHIYCKPVKIKDAAKLHNVESGESYSQKKSSNSEEKVPSSVVPIDVSGQTFSRMASFRRSLIHVDFLIRRKKKRDKRRNTVAEGSVKDLKEALEKSVRNDIQSPRDFSFEHTNSDSKNKHNFKIHEKQQPNDKSSVEQNNNADYIKAAKNYNHTNSMDNLIIQEEKNALNSERLKKEVNLIDSELLLKQVPSNKKKPKSHIPISTVSAAMNVAVEMRHDNGIKKESTDFNAVCNGNSYNFDSEDKLQDKRYSNSSNNEESSQDESWTDYKKRFHDKCRSLADRKEHNKRNLTNIETETSSSTSSENIDPQDTGATTSTESNTFFISSDESDEESSEVIYFQENCGSSTSVGTASDGSLNSLLSETGTEMTSSTGTLTSVGQEYILTPPPPPPPMIISATINDKDIVERESDSPCIEHNIEVIKNKKNSRTDNSQKQSRQLKLSKSSKPESVVSQKNASDNTKNIFSLVSLKTHTKHKNKKDTEKKKQERSFHQPAFDMYGNNSPVKTKKIPVFIKENYSPVIQKQAKSHMKSFLANDKSKIVTQIPFNEDSDKHKIDFILPRNGTSNSSDISDNTKFKATQTMKNIPTKYEHHVIVTPVQRCSNPEQENTHHKKSFASEKKHNSQNGNLSKSFNTNIENQVQIPQTHRANTTVVLQQQEKSKLAARVVLDFNGKVIYTTNSLDRNHHYPYRTVNMHNAAQNKICDPHFDDRYSNYYYDSHQKQDETKKQTNPVSSLRCNAVNFKESTSFSDQAYNLNDKYKNSDLNVKNPMYEHGCLSSSTKSSHSYRPDISKKFVPLKSDTRPFSYAGPNSFDSYFDDPSNDFLPNPNISGLPIQESMLTRHNVNLHSKQMEKMNMSSPECKSLNLSDSFCTTSPTNCGSILNKSPQSTMSTEDLFAVIHDCKKRMNIKTDSDISLASSSRSCSPSYLRPSSSKGTLAETGFLSPRSQAHLETGGDRRSWADFRPVDSVFYERKSLASDRLGPTKPTSMHDFKMLLLQARTSSQTSGQRKSAVEMLKLPLNQVNKNRNTIASPPSNLSPRTLVSSQISPTYELNVSNGHSTVPFKRGNRVRTSLQSRYIMYPPIFEDCSEDSEHCGDMISNKINISNIDTMSEKEDSNDKHNKINNNGCIQNHQEYSCDNAINTQVK